MATKPDQNDEQETGNGKVFDKKILLTLVGFVAIVLAASLLLT